MRAKAEEKDFAEFLLKIGDGMYPNEENIVQLPASMIFTNIIGDICGEEFRTLEEIMLFSKVAILAPKNDQCREINEEVLDRIPGEVRVYKSINSLITENDHEVLQFPVEFLDSLDLSGLAPHELHLKVGAIVMLLQNLNVAHGLL